MNLSTPIQKYTDILKYVFSVPIKAYTIWRLLFFSYSDSPIWIELLLVWQIYWNKKEKLFSIPFLSHFSNVFRIVISTGIIEKEYFNRKKLLDYLFLHSTHFYHESRFCSVCIKSYLEVGWKHSFYTFVLTWNYIEIQEENLWIRFVTKEFIYREII